MVFILHDVECRGKCAVGGEIAVRICFGGTLRKDTSQITGAVLPSSGWPSYYHDQVNNLSSDELRNWATVVAASVALLVFLVNSFFMVRNQRLENVSRFIEAHQRLFAREGYIATNMALIETGTLTRNRNDAEMEARFHLMLLEVERLAILANNNAVPRATQVYMFGWYARNILTVIGEKERDNMSWELVLGYLDGLGKDYTAYESLTRKQRERFWR